MPLKVAEAERTEPLNALSQKKHRKQDIRYICFRLEEMVYLDKLCVCLDSTEMLNSHREILYNVDKSTEQHITMTVYEDLEEGKLKTLL